MDKTGSLELRWIQGFINTNIEFVDEKTVCYGCGNHICFLNLETKVRSVFQSPGRGVGALTASGRSGTFAFSEQKLSPSIFVYIFPELELKNELKGIAQLDYSSLTLSDEGPYLGSCSSLPDYSITVWNWKNAEAICTQSQVGQDVVSLVFNPLNWLQLCALGTTTLTVWNIEKSDYFHILKPRVVELPAADGSFAARRSDTALIIDNKLPSNTLRSTRATLTPSALCWTATSKLYVGCAEGYLLLVDPENFSVSVIFNPTTADTIPELQKFNFKALTLVENDLIVVGKESVLHCVQIRETQTHITQTWPLEKPVTNVRLSPDNETLLLSASTGQIYLLNPSKSNKIMKILDVLSGNFLTAAFLQMDRNICVSLRDSGVLELWSSDGTCLGFLHLQTKVTSLACCPIAHYSAVGTESGRVLFVDLNKEPRLVHQVHLYHSAVDHLVFDQEGLYLFTCSGSDPHIYVIDAQPSARFSVLGYIVVSECILSISTQRPSDDEVKVLVLCAEQEGKREDGSLLIMVYLPIRIIAGPDCVDRYGCLSPHVVTLFKYKVPLPLTSCTLGASELFAYCERKKSLQRFQLPEETEGATSQEVVQLKPMQEVKGHPLGPASVLLSPCCLWLASAGQDGLLRIRQTDSIEQYIELLCHSCRLGGGRSVSFSSDGLTILTTGFNDGSLVCTNLRIKDVDEEKVNKAAQFSRFTAQALKKVFDSENTVLFNLPVWDEGSTKIEDREVQVQTSVNSTEEEERIGISPSAPPSDLTWLENKTEKVFKEDNIKHCEEKEHLRETVGKIRDTIQKMLRENDSLPVEQFNLDVEEQRRLEDMVEQEAERVRAETEQSIVEMCYRRDVLKRECWDSWMVKSRVIKAFHSELIVQNYPLKERAQRQLEDLHRVQNIRKLEEAACTLSGKQKSSNAEEQKQEAEGHEAGSAASTGSFSAPFERSSPYIYDQFSLQTIEQRINQAILLQDVIYGIKMAFNKEFEAQHKQKLQEMKRVGNRNKRIREITQELETDQELWEPGLTDSEWPESLLTVDDSEIKAEKYLTLEQKEEEERKLEEETYRAAQSDDSKERALDDMMDGDLEVKKVDILKVEIPLPAFVLIKSNKFWSEEEKNVYKEYEKKTSDLNKEKDKYKKSLETEIRKLQETSKEATVKFDQMLANLLEKKIESTAAIYREELKIIYLTESVLTEKEMRNSELELKLKLEKLLEYRQEISEEVVRCEYEVEVFLEAYENLVAKDKVLDKDFRREFSDVPRQIVDKLYKLFKHRPRVQNMRAQTESTSSLFKEHHLSGSLVPDARSQMLKSMDELDYQKCMPEGVNLAIWDKFCLLRKAKVESELQVQLKALTLAEMQAFLQRRNDEANAAQQEITNCSEELQRLHKNKNDHLINTRIQIVLKQGQVEALTPDLKAGSRDADFLLCHKGRVDNLREEIRKLVEEKIAIIEESKDVHKQIKQMEWTLKVLRNKIQDLKDKERNIKTLRLSEQQQDMKYCSEKEQAQRMSKKISNLEKSIALMKNFHQKKVQQCQKRIRQIKQQAAKKTRSTETLEQQLPGLQVTVAELTNVCGLAATEENVAAEREERYQEILERRNWKEAAISQAEELLLLGEEVERLRRRNFISLDELKHD